MNHPRCVRMTRQLIEGALVETTKLHQGEPAPELQKALDHLSYALEQFDLYPPPVPTPLHA